VGLLPCGNYRLKGRDGGEEEKKGITALSEAPGNTCFSGRKGGNVGEGTPGTSGKKRSSPWEKKKKREEVPSWRANH